MLCLTLSVPRSCFGLDFKVLILMQQNLNINIVSLCAFTVLRGRYFCVLRVVAVLTVLWIGFCLTGPISLCVDSCVYVFLRCIVLLRMCCIIVTRWGGPGKIEA